MLYLIGFFLLFVVVLLIIIILVFKKSKPQSCELTEKSKPVLTLESIIKILKNEKNDKDKVNSLVEEMAKKFPFPENEKEANKHFEFVYFYAKNPLPTAKKIVEMQKILSYANPKYAKQIEDFQMRGVEARKK